MRNALLEGFRADSTPTLEWSTDHLAGGLARRRRTSVVPIGDLALA